MCYCVYRMSMMNVPVSRVYTVVFVRTNSTTSPVTALWVGLARDVNKSSVTAALILARMAPHAMMCSKTTSVSE